MYIFVFFEYSKSMALSFPIVDAVVTKLCRMVGGVKLC
jgi:hypothetical protein